MPSRREALRTAATTVLASVSYGCIIDDGANEPLPPEEVDRPCWENIEGEEIDVQPLFNPEDEEEMVIPEGELISEYESFEDEDNPDFDAYVYTEDYSTTLLMSAEVYPTVEEAVERYEEIASGFSNTEEFSIADGAVREVSKDGESAEMVLRKSNAIGHLKSYIPERASENKEELTYPNPDITVTGYSRELRDYWGGTSDFEDNSGFCRQEVVKRQNPDRDE